MFEYFGDNKHAVSGTSFKFLNIIFTIHFTFLLLSLPSWLFTTSGVNDIRTRKFLHHIHLHNWKLSINSQWAKKHTHNCYPGFSRRAHFTLLTSYTWKWRQKPVYESVGWIVVSHNTWGLMTTGQQQLDLSWMLNTRNVVVTT